MVRPYVAFTFAMLFLPQDVTDVAALPNLQDNSIMTFAAHSEDADWEYIFREYLARNAKQDEDNKGNVRRCDAVCITLCMLQLV